MTFSWGSDALEFAKNLSKFFETRRQRDIVVVTALFYIALGVTAMVYLPGLSGPFVLDDFPQLNPIIEGLDVGNWAMVWRDYLISNSGPLGRPIAMATFIFNGITSGADIWQWKYTNLMIHLLNGVFVFLLSDRIICARENNRAGPYLPLLISVLWLLHPIQVSTVLYTVQRMAQLSALFVFAGLFCYCVGRQRQLVSQPRGALLVGAAFAVFFPLAVFSKESGLLFPLFVFLIEIFFFGFRGPKNARIMLSICFTLFLLLPCIIAAYALVFHMDALILRGYEVRDFTLQQRVVTELRVLVYYLYEVILPQQTNLGFYHDDLVVSKNLLTPLSGLFSLIVLCGLLALAWYLRKRNRLMAFGILFFFSAHLLESSIFPLELMFEHRNYLALYGILLALAGIVRANLTHKLSTILLAFASTAALTLVTIVYVDTWSSAEKMEMGMYAVHPRSPRIRIDIASYYTESGNYDKARFFLANYAGAGYDMQRAYIDCRQLRRLPDATLKQITFQPESKVTTYELQGFVELANLGLDHKCEFSKQEFIRILEEALNSHVINGQGRQILLMTKAHYLYSAGKANEAVAELDLAFAADRRNIAPLLLAARWLIWTGHWERARVYLMRAKEADAAIGGNHAKQIRELEGKLSGS